ncbi:MAG: hypothetical protein ACI9JM_001400 [Halioglobus sp.]|jgi:hypothetical protein
MRRLSSRYSNSPALRLRIDKSLTRFVLYLLLCFALIWAEILLFLAGYWILLCLFVPTAAILCWQLAQQRSHGIHLCWQKGLWQLEDKRGLTSIVLATHRVALPGLIYLAFFEMPDGQRQRLWLFNDSADRAQLRLLRARLTLQRDTPGARG